MRSRLVCLAALFTLATSSTLAGPPDEAPPAPFTLGPGTTTPAPAREAVTPAEARPLDEAATKALLDRLPALDPTDGGKDFARRAGPPPPPLTGTDVQAPFPPPPGGPPVEPAAGELEVLRWQPEGDVPLAPALAITFSQPMIPLASVDAATTAPVRLEPAPPGRWRWIGTRTVLFEPDAGRFPMATEFRVEVPAGTPAASGARLAKALAFGFRTPPPQVVSSGPTGGPTARDPLLHVTFDQAIDPAAVLATVRVEAAGERLPTRLATAEEARGLRSAPGRTLAFKVEGLLPVETDVQVTVEPGTPSLEGPRRLETPASFGFRTHGPLRVLKHEATRRGLCPPGTPLVVTFSNPLDRTSVSAERVTFDPPVTGLRVWAGEQELVVQGAAKANTTYRVTLSRELRDRFGQTLGVDSVLRYVTTDPEPRLAGPYEALTILDPAGAPRFDVRSIAVGALRIRVLAVDPTRDWPDFERWRHQPDESAPPGREVLSEVRQVQGRKDAWVDTQIDLSPALTAGLGHALVLVEPAEWREPWKPRLHTWVQATKLGLDVQGDRADVLAWVTRLEDGAPIADAEVRLLPLDAIARTGPDGLTRLACRPGAEFVVARQGGDTVLLPWQASWRAPGVERRWFTFDDRHLYRPGESVHVKGWARTVDLEKGGDVRAARAATVKYAVKVGGRRQLLREGTITLDALGGFDLAFELPDTVHVGQAALSIEGEHHHVFQIAEFRRPEFEVGVQATSAGPHVAGGALDAVATARYFAGGALPGAPVSWSVSSRAASFVPPGRRDFAFGEHVPWWVDEPARRGSRLVYSANFVGETDGQGQHALRVALGATERPLTLTVEATVRDVNRQAWAGRTTALVHPASLYVGLRPLRPYVGAGEPLEVDVVVVDLDGKAVPGVVTDVTFERLTWDWKEGKSVEGVAERQGGPSTSLPDPVRRALTRPTGGTWRVVATARDPAGRLARTVTRVWVAGGKPEATRSLEEEAVTLVPDRSEYAHGDQARLLVVAPFAPAEGLLTIRRSGLVRSQRFRMEGATHELVVPVDDALVPGFTAHVALVGAAPREGEATRLRPAHAAGELRLSVPPRRRTLQVTVTPAKAELAPGESTSIDLIVRDPAGQPVADAEVAVAVVDEAVLSLAGHTQPDPLAAFYEARPAGVSDGRARSLLRLQSARELSGLEDGLPGGSDSVSDAMGVGGGGGERRAAYGGRARPDGDGGADPIGLRKDLSPLALFAPRVRTDAAGRARVDLKLPDSLTRWRVTAVAAAGEQSFGAAEAVITARLPLVVRPSPPRFLSFGDRCELPVVVQNLTDAPLEVDVALRATNLELAAGAGQRLTVPARDRREVRFKVAAVRAGRVRLQLVAGSGDRADAQELTFPVWTPATAEAFATYGTLDGERAALAQPVVAPDAWPQVGGLEVTTSSTGLQALTDAVIYLVDYPYGCAEQVASRVLALVAVKDVLAAFQAEGLPSAATLDAAVRADLDRLGQLQNQDGGWGFWRAGEPSWPYLTIHAAHALVRAKAKGHAVDGRALERAQRALASIERMIPAWYSAGSRRALVAYALHVRAKLGDVDVERARRLLTDAGLDEDGLAGLPIEAHGWLLPVLRRGGAAAREDAARVRRHLANRVTETAGAAHFVTSTTDGAHVLLHSDRRADGVVLEALLDDPAEAQGDLAPKLVQGLLGHRTRGRWLNTQENAFVLLALDAYFRAAEGTPPDFVARVWLGDAFAGDHAFRGRTTERAHVLVPMADLQRAGAAPRLVLGKEGPGRLYYRIGLRYAPKDLALPALDQGFTVQRRYEAVDDPADVRRDADGAWRVKAGARVRVRLAMVATSRRLHVALTDPLPAGLEPIDPGLKASGALPPDPQGAAARRGWWTRTWYEHSGLRDERAEAFTSLLWEGTHAFTYVCRATTPGTFVAAPARAEEMYAPETFGRSGTDRVIVE